ncbi:serine hydrolase [Acuticoccus sediminis]|uniref:serine hydrolase n=1 Tax=Acuticoccus sediminis TaxID=2184697 RepID=UPI001CFE0BDF|nr:serine hydrolase [Acuticoccus sediminis]
MAVAPAAAANPKYAGLVIDVISGKDLYADRADEMRYPASLTKIMTLYVVFEELSAGRMTLDTDLTMSKYAASQPPSKIGIRPGGTMAMRDAIKALVTKSANDVAAMVAENISGSVPAFTARMTKTAHRLGMKHTTFTTPSGLPDPNNKTTARDMAKLGIAIQRDFPQYYGVFQTRVFEYGKRRYANHNRLLGRVEGVDGIKTGYINASGFNLVTSVRRDGRQLVAVVMGGSTGRSRDNHMAELIAKYLPQAQRGDQLMYMAWSDYGPPPIPKVRPTLAVRFASRLKEREETPQSDDIQTILAFASQTREAAGTIAHAAPRTATDALQAVISSEGDAPAPSAGPLPSSSSISENVLPDDPAPVTGAEVEVASLDPTIVPSPSAGRPHRFSAAFEVFGEANSAGQDNLVALIARRTVPTSGLTIIAMGSAPQTAGDRAPIDPGSPKNRTRMEIAVNEAPVAPHQPTRSAANQLTDTAANQNVASRDSAIPKGWQIQLGAVNSESAAKTILEEAERTEPAMAQRVRVTLPTATPNGTVYRARFAGFGTEAEALSACKLFTNHNRPCWAVSM